MRHRVTTGALLVAIVLLFALPVLLHLGSSPADGGERYGGSDSQATEEIEASHPGYRPWFGPLFSPSGEVESGLFAIQAALGAGGLGYVIGRFRGRSRTELDRPGPVRS